MLYSKGQCMGIKQIRILSNLILFGMKKVIEISLGTQSTKHSLDISLWITSFSIEKDGLIPILSKGIYNINAY